MFRAEVKLPLFPITVKDVEEVTSSACGHRLLGSVFLIQSLFVLNVGSGFIFPGAGFFASAS